MEQCKNNLGCGKVRMTIWQGFLLMGRFGVLWNSDVNFVFFLRS